MFLFVPHLSFSCLFFFLITFTQIHSKSTLFDHSQQIHLNFPVYDHPASISLNYREEIPGYYEGYFNQYTDHFNYYSHPDQYLQRFLLNDTFWRPDDGVIFFYCGNEGDIVWFWNNTGFIFDIAAQFGALIIFGEHRYYGESWPISEEKAHVHGNNGFLSVEQALADYAELLNFIQLQISINSPEELSKIWKEHDNKNLQKEEAKKVFSMDTLFKQTRESQSIHLKDTTSSTRLPVIAFGGSYGGMLAGWFRLHYPSIVDGALASSAPIPMASVPSRRNSTEFWELVTDDWRTVDSRCPSLVQEGFNQLLNLSSQGTSGLNQLKSIFSLCYLESKDIEELILWIVNGFGYLAMGDYPYSAEFLGSLPAWPVNVSCSFLVDNQDQPIYGIAATTSMYYNSSGDLECFDLYEEYIACADPTGCGTGSEGKSWDYQACSEIIYYPATTNVTDMFPPRTWDAANATAYCQKTWDITQRLEWTEISLGGEDRDFAESSRIIFSNGELDPWSTGGFLNDVSDSVITLLIPQAAHHLDLRAANPDDPEPVVEARQKEVEIISSWIEEVKKENY